MHYVKTITRMSKTITDITDWYNHKRDSILETCKGRHPWEEGCWPMGGARVIAEIKKMERDNGVPPDSIRVEMKDGHVFVIREDRYA